MRDYGKVYTRFRLKQNVLSWSDSAKLLGLYLLTCPHCNLLGCFRLPTSYVASDLNWDEQLVAKALNELEQDQFLIRCEESGWTLIRSFLKHNPIENSNQGKAAFRLLKDVPADFIGMASLLKSLAAFQARLPEEFSSLFMPDGNPVRDSQRSDDSDRSNKPTVKTVDQIQFVTFQFSANQITFNRFVHIRCRDTRSVLIWVLTIGFTPTDKNVSSPFK